MATGNIDNLSISITSNADRAVSAINKVASAFGTLKGATTTAANGVDNVNAKTDEMVTATSEAQNEVSSFGAKLRSVAAILGNFGRQTAGVVVKGMGRITGAIGGLASSILRIAKFRIIRSLLKDMAQSFRDLYGWSKAFGTDFYKSMDTINTSFLYFRNSVAAAVAPLINLFAPAIDMIIDGVVEVLNVFNQLFAALSGADTYTVAKKVAQQWEDTFDSTGKSASSTKKKVDDLKRTLLGFDEINKLNDKNKSSTGGGSNRKSSPYTQGYKTMFEEKPLEGLFKKISDITSGMPDWLKWLLGGATLVGGFLLIKKFIPWLLKKIGELFAFKIPDWLKWLFGPKDGKGIDIDIPKIPDIPVKFDVPEIEVPKEPVNLPVKFIDTPEILWDKFKKDWNGIGSLTLYMSPKLDNTAAVLWRLFKEAWNALVRTLYLSPKLDNSAKVLLDSFKNDWNAQDRTVYLSPKLDNQGSVLWAALKKEWDAARTALYASPKLDNTGKVLWTTFKKEWKAARVALYASPKLDNKAKALWDAFKKEWDNQIRTLYASPKLDNTAKVLLEQFKKAWNALERTVYLSPKLDNTAAVLLKAFKEAWNAIDRTLYMAPKLDNTAKVIYNGFKNDWNGLTRTLYVSPKLDNKASVLFNEFKRDWDDIANVVVNVDLEPTWHGTTKYALRSDDLDTIVNIDVSVPWSWYGPIDYLGLNNLDTTINFNVQTAWDYYGYSLRDYLGLDNLETTIPFYVDTIWWYYGKSILEYLGLTNLKTTVYVYTKKAGGKVPSSSSSSSTGKYGGATGGGGSTDGGGVGRGRHALGGIFSNGSWSAIPQYANGTDDAHGTLFLAGEAGPEIVGHVGGRTEVLNKSQLAATMYQAVNSAMKGVTLDAHFYGSGMDGGNDEALIDMMRQNVSATERQNELLRQQNEYLRQLNEKDTTVEISANSIARGLNRQNRRAGTTVVPVGT